MGTHPSRPLTSLPEDILIEILTYLLVDTPRSRSRAAVVRTCSTLHDLGLPLLYRVVDLRGYVFTEEVVNAWDRLFGPRGSLGQDGRVKQLGEHVVELRIAGPVFQSDFDAAVMRAFDCRPVHLPRCTSLVITPDHLPPRFSLSFATLLSSLPIDRLTLLWMADGNPFICRWAPTRLDVQLFGSTVQPWPGLRTVRMHGVIWVDPVPTQTPWSVAAPRISLADWSFPELVIDAPKMPLVEHQQGQLIHLLLHPVGSDDTTRLGRRRIELRVPLSVKDEFGRRLEKEKRAGPLSALQKRILALVVFVGEDGNESRLIEPEDAV